MIQVWSLTDTGLVRKENQDAYAVLKHEASGYTACVVCDGMGGVSGGRIASRLAADTYIQELDRILRPKMGPEEMREASFFAVAKANRAIQEAAATDQRIAQMGTTLVSVIADETRAVVTNVGDSRAYHITHAGIVQLTKDHSLVESMVERGNITADEARRHPRRNLITRALGAETNATCDGYVRPLRSGEFLLLCTDGLINTVTDQEILFEVLHGDDPATTLNRLLEISKQNGAADNVTAVLVQIL